MSTLAYALLTTKRDEAPEGTSETASPGVKTYVDALAALIPAEVLVAHATILSVTTSSEKDESTGQVVTTITEDATLEWVFFVLVGLSALLYLFGRWTKLDLWDGFRAFIPPLAFVGWTMLQKTSSFDAVAPNFNSATRFAVAVIGAIVLGLAAGALAYKADARPNPADGHA